MLLLLCCSSHAVRLTLFASCCPSRCPPRCPSHAVPLTFPHAPPLTLSLALPLVLPLTSPLMLCRVPSLSHFPPTPSHAALLTFPTLPLSCCPSRSLSRRRSRVPSRAVPL